MSMFSNTKLPKLSKLHSVVKMVQIESYSQVKSELPPKYISVVNSSNGKVIKLEWCPYDLVYQAYTMHYDDIQLPLSELNISNMTFQFLGSNTEYKIVNMAYEQRRCLDSAKTIMANNGTNRKKSYINPPLQLPGLKLQHINSMDIDSITNLDTKNIQHDNKTNNKYTHCESGGIETNMVCNTHIIAWEDHDIKRVSPILMNSPKLPLVSDNIRRGSKTHVYGSTSGFHRMRRVVSRIIYLRNNKVYPSQR